MSTYFEWLTKWQLNYFLLQKYWKQRIRNHLNCKMLCYPVVQSHNYLNFWEISQRLYQDLLYILCIIYYQIAANICYSLLVSILSISFYIPDILRKCWENWNINFNTSFTVQTFYLSYAFVTTWKLQI